MKNIIQTIKNKKASISIEMLLGIIAALIALIVLLKFYDILKSAIMGLPG